MNRIFAISRQSGRELCIEPNEAAKHMCTKGSEEPRSGEQRRRLAFVYPDFFPIRGGQSIHGYHLARELSALDWRIWTWGRQEDGFTRGVPRSIPGMMRLLQRTDLLYFRMGIDRKWLHEVPGIARWLGKKVVVELNAPTDELIAKGVCVRDLAREDARLGRQIRAADVVIVVSDALAEYCRGLGARRVVAIPNGGARFDGMSAEPSEVVREALRDLRAMHDRVVIWSGTNEPWQGVEVVRKMIGKAAPNVGFLVVTNDSSAMTDFRECHHVRLLPRLPFSDVAYLLANADIGLAVYGAYDWCRIGFYGSSLKYFEYLANGLYVAASAMGHMAESRLPQVCASNDPDELVHFIESVDVGKVRTFPPSRSWRDVAMETHGLLCEVLGFDPSER